MRCSPVAIVGSANQSPVRPRGHHFLIYRCFARGSTDSHKQSHQLADGRAGLLVTQLSVPAFPGTATMACRECPGDACCAMWQCRRGNQGRGAPVSRATGEPPPLRISRGAWKDWSFSGEQHSPIEDDARLCVGVPGPGCATARQVARSSRLYTFDFFDRPPR